MPVWPLPKEFEHGHAVLWLSDEARITCREEPSKEKIWEDYMYSEHENSRMTPRPLKCPPYVLWTAFARFWSQIFSQQFTRNKYHGKDAQQEPGINDPMATIQEVVIEEWDHEVNPALSREAYAITVSQDGSVNIRIACPEGGIHAFNTLAQMFYVHSTGTVAYTPHAPIVLKDAPTFSHRGLLLDISRNFLSSQDVMRTIEGMAFTKLNKLHIHATDSQSWRLEIPSLPILAKKSAHSEHQVWTVRDLEEVQNYGVYNGIEVYLELDLPGHAGSISHSFPHLVTAYDQCPWSLYAYELPAGQLRLNSPDVFAFLDSLFNDILPRVSDLNHCFHIGGGELNAELYKIDPTVNSSSKDIIQPFLQKLMDHLFSLVERNGLFPHLWEEMLLEWDLSFPSNTTFQAWRPGGLSKIVAKGYRGIFSFSTDWDFDSGFGTFIDPDSQNPKASIGSPCTDRQSRYKNRRQMLSIDPLANIPKERQHLVVGGEVCFSSELNDGVTLAEMIWPRAAAAAEMMWSGKREVGEETTRRLEEVTESLIREGNRAGEV